jgi:hypothetical protein
MTRKFKLPPLLSRSLSSLSWECSLSLSLLGGFSLSVPHSREKKTPDLYLLLFRNEILYLRRRPAHICHRVALLMRAADCPPSERAHARIWEIIKKERAEMVEKRFAAGQTGVMLFFYGRNLQNLSFLPLLLPGVFALRRILLRLIFSAVVFLYILFPLLPAINFFLLSEDSNLFFISSALFGKALPTKNIFLEQIL